MTCGMKNSPATLQQMINQLIERIEGCEANIDDVVVYSDTWKDHLSCLRNLLAEFADANLTVDLVKSEFGHAEVTFMGHIVGSD